MAGKLYKLNEFIGIDESISENGLGPGYSSDARNMDTSDGNLSVAKGYVRHIAEPVPGTGEIHRMTLFRSGGVEEVIAIAGDCVYAYKNGAWSRIYTYPAPLSHHSFDFITTGINSCDHLLIGCGEAQIVKYDGTTASVFGSAEGVSNIHALHLEMYMSRLFAAGDPEHPSRLYWSQLPGDTRTIEDWSAVEASPNVEGGHAEVGPVGSDPIMGLWALSNQLVIFKRDSIYRLIGDKPGNFTIENVDASSESAAHTSIVQVGDALFFMTRSGMACYNGVSAAAAANARQIKRTAGLCDTSASRGAYTRDMLYFTLKKDGADMLVQYDTVRGAHMLRDGFCISDICARDGRLYLINANRYVYRFGEGADYDGVPVRAWWQTPVTDLYDKSSVKAMRELYLRGKSENGAALIATVYAGQSRSVHRLLLPEIGTEVLETPLKGEGRTFSMRFENEAGGSFTVENGAELAFEEWRRTQ